MNNGIEIPEGWTNGQETEPQENGTTVNKKG